MAGDLFFILLVMPDLYLFIFCFLLSFDPCFVLRNKQYKIKTFGSMFSSLKSSRKEKLFFLVAKYLVDIDMFSPFLIHLPPHHHQEKSCSFPKIYERFRMARCLFMFLCTCLYAHISGHLQARVFEHAA
jgi:hypothetical protein